MTVHHAPIRLGVIVLDLPFRIESLNRTQRLGIGQGSTLAALRRRRFGLARKVKTQRAAACLALQVRLPARDRAQLLTSSERVVITLTRRGPGELDNEDNLAAGFKPTRDGIADALGLADNDGRLRWFYGQERTARGVYGARVQIEAMTRVQLGARLLVAEVARP